MICSVEMQREPGDAAYEDLTIWRHSLVDGVSIFQRNSLVELKMDEFKMSGTADADVSRSALMGENNTLSMGIGQILKLVSIYSHHGFFGGFIQVNEGLGVPAESLFKTRTSIPQFAAQAASSVSEHISSLEKSGSGVQPALKKFKSGNIDQNVSKFPNSCCRAFSSNVAAAYPTLDAPDVNGRTPFLSLLGSMKNQVVLSGGCVVVEPAAIGTMQPRGRLESLWIAPAKELFGNMGKNQLAGDYIGNASTQPPAGFSLIGEFISNIASIDFESKIYLVDQKVDAFEFEPEFESGIKSIDRESSSFHLTKTPLVVLWPFSQFDVIASGGHSIIAVPNPGLVGFSTEPCIVKIAPDIQILGEWDAHKTLDCNITRAANTALRRLCHSSGIFRIMTEDGTHELHQVVLRNPIGETSSLHIAYRALLLEGVGIPIVVNSFQGHVDGRAQTLYTLCRAALELMHQHGWTHCDLKPDNIIEMPVSGPKRRFYDVNGHITEVDFPKVCAFIFIFQLFCLRQYRWHVYDYFVIQFMLNDIALALPFASLPQTAGHRIGSPQYQVRRSGRAYAPIDDLCSLTITALHLAGCPLDPNPAATVVLETIAALDDSVFSALVRGQMMGDLQRVRALNQAASAPASIPAASSQQPLPENM
jgi:hypothetical protein